MLKKLSVIAVLILCFFTVNVNAQERDDADASPRSEGLDQRVTDRLKTLKISLNDKQAEAIKDKCEAAQGKIKAIQKKAENYSDAYNAETDKILNRLDGLNHSLRNQGADTTSIDKAVEEIGQTKIKIDSTDKNYLLAVSDSALIDCRQSPEGFRLSVDDAKKQFSELQDLRKSQQDQFKGGLKEALVNLRDSL